MQILVFNPRFLEPAHHLAVRTGLEICKGDWKPEPHKGYILFGAEEQLKLLMEVQDKLDLVYIVMNGISPDNTFPEYLDFARKNKLICQNIAWCAKYQELGVFAEYGINEYFVNEPKPERRIHYLLWGGSSRVSVGSNKKALYLTRDEVYTPEELTNKMTSCETYVTSRKDDWDFINKAIACGMNVLSCHQDADMEEIYKPFVCFVDEIDLSTRYEYPCYDNQLFLKTVSTYSLNKMLPVIKDAYINTEGTKKEQSVTISTGEDEEGNTYADITPKTEENDISG